MGQSRFTLFIDLSGMNELRKGHWIYRLSWKHEKAFCDSLTEVVYSGDY